MRPWAVKRDGRGSLVSNFSSVGQAAAHVSLTTGLQYHDATGFRDKGRRRSRWRGFFYSPLTVESGNGLSSVPLSWRDVAWGSLELGVLSGNTGPHMTSTCHGCVSTAACAVSGYPELNMSSPKRNPRVISTYALFIISVPRVVPPYPWRNPRGQDSTICPTLVA